MRRYYCIVNLFSGGGKARHIITKIQYILLSHHIKCTVSTTSIKGATSLAKEAAAEGFTHVIAVGGDGTVNEVVNGIAGTNTALGVIPAGSGNDFARTLYSNALSLDQILETLAQGNLKTIDLGQISSENTAGKITKKHFVNGVGIGLDAKVAYEANRFKWLPADFMYVIAALKTIATYKSSYVSVYNQELIDSGKQLLIAVGNGKSAGGGFYLTPNAELSDGMFDICLVKGVGILKILRIFPTVFKGKHGKFPEVKFFRTDALHVITENGLPVHIDGEILGLHEKDIQINLKNNALNVISP